MCLTLPPTTSPAAPAFSFTLSVCGFFFIVLLLRLFSFLFFFRHRSKPMAHRIELHSGLSLLVERVVFQLTHCLGCPRPLCSNSRLSDVYLSECVLCVCLWVRVFYVSLPSGCVQMGSMSLLSVTDSKSSTPLLFLSPFLTFTRRTAMYSNNKILLTIYSNLGILEFSSYLVSHDADKNCPILLPR